MYINIKCSGAFYFIRKCCNIPKIHYGSMSVPSTLWSLLNLLLGLTACSNKLRVQAAQTSFAEDLLNLPGQFIMISVQQCFMLSRCLINTYKFTKHLPSSCQSDKNKEKNS